jgi:hypothetical protein
MVPPYVCVHYLPIMFLLHLSSFYPMDMVELLLPSGFNTLEYSWVKAIIGICTLADYFVAKECH